MARFDYRKLDKKQRDELLREVAASVRKLESTEDTQRFLEQLLTPSEVAMVGRRWQAAKMLMEEKSYYEIRLKLGVGMSTIESVDKWLRRSIDDYPALVAVLRKDPKVKKKEFRRRYGSQFGSFNNIRRRYPLHFLLINLILGD